MPYPYYQGYPAYNQMYYQQIPEKQQELIVLIQKFLTNYQSVFFDFRQASHNSK